MDTVDKEILKKYLIEEKDDDEILLWYLSEEKRKQHDPLFTKRSAESYHEILINGQLKNNEIRFREFFRYFLITDVNKCSNINENIV